MEDGQAPNPEPTNQEQDGSPAHTPAASPQEDVEAIKAELASARKALEDVRNEAAARRVKAREAAEKAGEFEKAKQLLEEELAEARSKLEGLPELQKAREELEAYRKAREEQVSSMLEQVADEDMRAILAKLPDVEDRASAIQKYLTKQGARPSVAPPGATPAASSGPAEYREGLSKEDPQAWAALKKEMGVPASSARRPFFARK